MSDLCWVGVAFHRASTRHGQGTGSVRHDTRAVESFPLGQQSDEGATKAVTCAGRVHFFDRKAFDIVSLAAPYDGCAVFASFNGYDFCIAVQQARDLGLIAD